jgi:hypothetical protein
MDDERTLLRFDGMNEEDCPAYLAGQWAWLQSGGVALSMLTDQTLGAMPDDLHTVAAAAVSRLGG